MRASITLAICILSIWHAQSAESKSPPNLEACIDALFANVVGDRPPGFALLVSKEGRVLVQKGYGLAVSLYHLLTHTSGLRDHTAKHASPVQQQ